MLFVCVWKACGTAIVCLYVSACVRDALEALLATAVEMLQCPTQWAQWWRGRGMNGERGL